MMALFLVAVLGAIGIAMSRLSNVEHDTRTKAVLASRVYYGAKAGLEFSIQQAITADLCGAGAPALSAGLTGVSVTTGCVRTIHGAGNFSYYITSNATTGTIGAVTYAERRMEATVSNIP